MTEAAVGSAQENHYIAEDHSGLWKRHLRKPHSNAHLVQQFFWSFQPYHLFQSSRMNLRFFCQWRKAVHKVVWKQNDHFNKYKEMIVLAYGCIMRGVLFDFNNIKNVGSTLPLTKDKHRIICIMRWFCIIASCFFISCYTSTQSNHQTYDSL